MEQQLKLLKAKVWHLREQPKRNEFTYNVYYVSHPVTGSIHKKPRLFSYNRFNILSLFTKDLGSKNGEQWLTWVSKEYADAGIVVAPDDSIELITHPRLFGYAFNPISFWLLLNSAGELRAVLCEVHNTFGDDHNYVLANADGSIIKPNNLFRADKALYVSPFNSMDGYYTFTFKKNEAFFKADIIYYVDDAFVLKTAMSGTYEKLSSLTILSLLIRYPFMTLLVVVRIHWQALVLFTKKLQHTLAQKPSETHGKTTHGKLQKK